MRLIERARRGERGADWYAQAGDDIAQYAERNGFSCKRVCDVLAILSPRVTVKHNVRLARAYLETGSIEGLMRARVRALRQYEGTGRFGGSKVNAFSLALQGDPDAVVLDVWMGRAMNLHEKLTPKRYREASTKVRATATRLGWQAREAQAAIWTQVRAENGWTNQGRIQL